uniref:MutS protein homolog 4-like n=1 Tax=Petromyzon marinus TaxID=7757 RepID=A0AAJ7SK95_PETMA|nr:mutS protein homolog 4-like [Petromyzon marinus]
MASPVDAGTRRPTSFKREASPKTEARELAYFDSWRGTTPPSRLPPTNPSEWRAAGVELSKDEEAEEVVVLCSLALVFVRRGGESSSRPNEYLGPFVDILQPSLGVSKRGNLLSYTTMDLMRLNCRSQEAVEEIYLMSNVVLSKLFAEIREDIVCLYKLADAVSMVDMLLAFAHRTTLTKSVRPEFSDTLALKGARHPILERVLGWPLVPNDVFLSDASNFLIVTGPNNSGKSTLLRQVALCQVMAQIGCFVPADFACVRIADQIFTRIGVDDDIQPLSSTFTIEMREVNYIVRTATDRSLVIIDELGRGTGVHEALGICHSVCECLLQRKTFTIFATHHLELSHLSTLYPNVSNSHFLVESRNQQQQQQLPWAGRCDGKAAGADDSRTVPRVTCTYKLVQGHTPDTHYGLEMATLSSLPPSLLRDATGLLARIGGKSWMERQADSAPVLRRAAVHRLATRLGQAARHSRLDGASLASYLGSLRQRYLDELEHIADATANTH